MRRSFKGSYKPAVNEYDLNHHAEVYHPFENSYWGVSLEGMANLTHLTKDSKTNRFFLGNYYGNLERSYSYLYLLALHQRYALLNTTIQAAQLPNTMNAYLQSDDPKAKEQLQMLKEKMVFFTLRSSHRQVSSSTHQSKLYEIMRSVFKIEELMNELHFKLDTILHITSMQNDILQKARLEQEEEERIMMRKSNELKINIRSASKY